MIRIDRSNVEGEGTAGLGAWWLHIRVGSYPKSYRFHPYESPRKGLAMRLAAATALAVIGCGCATFSDLPPSKAPPRIEIPADHAMKQFDLVLITTYDPLERSEPWSPQPVEAYSGDAIEALRASGWFSKVAETSSLDAADAELRLKKFQGGIQGGILNALSLFLVPSTTQWSLTVSVTFHPQRPDAPRCTRAQHYRSWTQLFLLPVAFSRSQARYEREFVRRSTLACVGQLLRDTEHLGPVAPLPGTHP